jgi:hypothetical protein
MREINVRFALPDPRKGPGRRRTAVSLGAEINFIGRMVPENGI